MSLPHSFNTGDIVRVKQFRLDRRPQDSDETFVINNLRDVICTVLYVAGDLIELKVPGGIVPNCPEPFNWGMRMKFEEDLELVFTR